MAKVKSTTPEEEKEKFYENPEVLEESIDQAEEFVNNNQSILIGVLVAIAVAVAGYFFYQNYTQDQNKQAEQELFPAVFFFEQDSLTQALEGDGSTTMGLVAITNDYSGTKAANLANFYAGASYLKLGEFDQAVNYLEKFSSEEYLLEARAQSLVGDAYSEKGEYGQAASAYLKAANKYPNAQFSPLYLQKAAIAQEANGDLSAALQSYEKIVNDFPDADLVTRSKKEVARLRILAK